jgi:hypothetical protein
LREQITVSCGSVATGRIDDSAWTKKTEHIGRTTNVTGISVREKESIEPVHPARAEIWLYCSIKIAPPARIE